MEKIEFPNSIFIAYEEVRQSGICNMFDGVCVVNEMIKKGYVIEAGYLVKFKEDGSSRLDGKSYSKLLKEVSEIHSITSKLGR